MTDLGKVSASVELSMRAFITKLLQSYDTMSSQTFDVLYIMKTREHIPPQKRRSSIFHKASREIWVPTMGRLFWLCSMKTRFACTSDLNNELNSILQFDFPQVHQSPAAQGCAIRFYHDPALVQSNSGAGQTCAAKLVRVVLTATLGCGMCRVPCF